MLRRFELLVTDSERRMRLEDFLFARFGELSRMYLRDLIKSEKCEVNGRFENRGFRLKPNDFVEIEIDPTRANAMRPEEIPLEILYEDQALLVVNKPAGMLVHPTHRDKTGTLLNALSFHLNRNGGAAVRPGLVHRLDKQTSGLIVVAKDARIHRVLGSQFHRKLVRKRYLALVEGLLENSEGTIEAPIGRIDELKYWDVKHNGKHSLTRYWVRERADDVTFLELEPVTGRTNQLRIHCAAIGHPIVGDRDRGGREHSRLCLHAWMLGFDHPGSGQRMVFETAVPADFDLNAFRRNR